VQQPVDRIFVTALLMLSVFPVLAEPVAASDVPELRARLLDEATPAGERGVLVANLIQRGEAGEAVLDEVLRGPREDLASAVRRMVLGLVHEPLLDAALVGATEGDLESSRNRRLIDLLADRAAEAEGVRRTRLLRLLGWSGGWDAVDALIALWKGGINEASGTLQRILPREFPSAAAAEEWVAPRRERNFEKVLAELVRPPAFLRELESEMARLREELVELAKDSLDGLEPPLLAARYLRSADPKVRLLGATYLENAKQLGGETTKAVAAALAAALVNADEEVATLVKLLDASRVHVAGLKALPDDRASTAVTPLLKREERVIREHAVEFLGDLGDTEAIPYLQDLFGAEDRADTALRAAVIGALHRIGDGITPWVIDQLTVQLDAGENREVVVTLQLVKLLGKRGDLRAWKVLARALGEVDDNEEIRRRAAEALEGVVQSEDAVDALIDLGLRDESHGVRRAAAGALQSAKGSEAAVAALEERLREDEQPAVRQQAALSLRVLLGAQAGPRLAPFSAADDRVAAELEEAVKVALTAADLDTLLATARALVTADPARCVSLTDRVLKASWPEERNPDLARMELLRADALSRGDDPAKGLAALEAIPEDAPLAAADRLLVRAGALRRTGRADEAEKLLSAYLSNGPEGRTVALQIERTRALLAAGRPEEASSAGTTVALRQDLSPDEEEEIRALLEEIEKAVAAGAARVEQIVAAWLDGTGGEGAIDKVRELGDRAHGAFRSRLEKLTDTEAPETAAYLARLREVTGREFGFESAETPEARAAARQKWLDFLGP
jgi:HEAT repeat protein